MSDLKAALDDFILTGDKPAFDAALARLSETPRPETVVIHIRDANDDRWLYRDRIYIGRACHGWPSSKWANPYRIGHDGTREQVLAKYEAHVRGRPDLMAALHEIRGRVLMCWCAPSACHGNTLIRLLAEQQT